jgi:selenocysteine-specific elongation factor
MVDEIAHDHFLTRASVTEIAKVIGELAASTQANAFPVAQLRDRLNIGRNLAVRILEFFDRQGVTARHGALRRVNARRLEPFRTATD